MHPFPMFPLKHQKILRFSDVFGGEGGGGGGIGNEWVKSTISSLFSQKKPKAKSMASGFSSKLDSVNPDKLSSVSKHIKPCTSSAISFLYRAFLYSHFCLIKIMIS